MKVPIRSRVVPVGGGLLIVMMWLGVVGDVGGLAICVPAGPVRVGDGACGVLGAVLLMVVVVVIASLVELDGMVVGWMVAMAVSLAQVLPIVLHLNISPSERRFWLQSVARWVVVPHSLQIWGKRVGGAGVGALVGAVRSWVRGSGFVVEVFGGVADCERICVVWLTGGAGEADVDRFLLTLTQLSSCSS